MIPLLVILGVPNLFLSWIYKGLRDITSRSPPCDRLAVLISLGLELEQGQLLIVFSIYTQVFLSCLAVSHLGVFLKRTLVEFLAGAGSDWNALFAGRPLVQFPCLIPSNQSAVGSFWPPPPPVRSLLIWLVRWRTHLRWGCLYPRSDRRVIGTKRIKDHGHRQVANWTMLNHKLTLSCPITTIGQCVCGENEARTGFRFVDAGVQHLLSIVPWCSNSNSVWFWKC